MHSLAVGRTVCSQHTCKYITDSLTRSGKSRSGLGKVLWNCKPIFNRRYTTPAAVPKKPKIPRTIAKFPQSPTSIRETAATHLNIDTEDVVYKSCATASTCEKYDLGRVMYLLHNAGIRTAKELLPGGVISAKFPLGSPREAADIIVLSNGSVVVWGMEETEVLSQIVPLLKSAEIRPYKSVETEDMDYVVNEKVSSNKQKDENPSAKSHDRSTMIGDLIVIVGNDTVLDKAAFSSGLARSTKLAALEQSLEKYILSIKGYSERLAQGDVLKLADRDVLKATGQWLQIRGQLNLYSELIETPDLYWSEPELETLYTLISKQLDIAPRISILNKKLDYASEFVGIIKSYTSERTSTKLEWMIIILIMVEVVFETFHTFDRVKTSYGQSSEPVKEKN